MPNSTNITTLTELLSGILRFFPNSMLVTLFVLGITTGRIAWILVALGGLVIAGLVLLTQSVFGSVFGGLGDFPGIAVVEACSLVPIAKGGVYRNIPSLWVAMSSFFVTYILTNAISIYTRQPLGVSKDKLAVQQRKGMGLISMIAVLILFAFLLVPRYWTTCENIWGLVLGLVFGIGGGYGWWRILSAGGSDVFPDIHGVMIGLKPGSLHLNPLACSAKGTVQG